MWTKAVWVEGKREEEGVVPMSWVNKAAMLLYWPPKNAAKAMNEKRVPTEKWKKFKLIKCKISSGNATSCYLLMQ